MESKKIMDRLICGDVGYGKTEVAIRAAFKAVDNGKQVAYLVPTTILAQQHYNTFKERMKEFPVEIRLLCRFCTPREVRETIADLKAGKVDIVIGTHRLLSKDVAFKQLGLLIIDEEQRFGVTHKEKIKQMKTNVDVLTLTATPIPRTLHMSLIGIRDMSVLEEAPVDRRAIQTYVMELDPELVKEAIKRELARDGQVYYVYNRVNNIEMVTSEIASLVPDAVVEYAHGQMHERELEKVLDSLSFDDLGSVDPEDAKRIAKSVLGITKQNLVGQVEERLNAQQQALQATYAQQQHELLRRDVEARNRDIMRVHPDFFALQETPQYREFMSQPITPGSTLTRDAVAAKEYQQGNTAFVIELLNQMKQSSHSPESIMTVAPVQSATSMNAASTDDNTSPAYTLRELNDMYQMRVISLEEWRKQRAKLRNSGNA